jgi:hypothetical protein
MTFVRRKIDLTFILGEGDFGEGGFDTVKVSGLKVHASIIKGGAPSNDQASIQVFGLRKDLMNTLSRLGRKYGDMRNNAVVIEAGDDTNGMTQVFAGDIWDSYADLDNAPEAALNITAVAGALSACKPIPPSSFPGAAAPEIIAAQLAGQMSYTFVNAGVSGTALVDSYFPGTAMDQLRSLAQAAGFDYCIDAGPNGGAGDNKQVLTIWPKGAKRGDGPAVGPTTGLVGYPRYADVGVAIRSLYKPGFLLGMQIQLDTDIEAARGAWNLISVVYSLQSETPHGDWFADMLATRPSSVK